VQLHVKKRNGRIELLRPEAINKSVERACLGIADVSVSDIVLSANMQLFDKIPTKEIDLALIMSARTLIEREPNYSKVAARLLVNTIYKESFGEGVDHDTFEHQYRVCFTRNLKRLVKLGRIDPRLIDGRFDLQELANALDLNCDELWTYHGLQTIYDRYLIHKDGRRLEAPQSFFMRVAMGVAINEAEPTRWAIKFYGILSQHRGMSSTPTLFNSGTTRPQMSSCYLTTVGDSIDGIFGAMHQLARLSKFAGGLGVDFTAVRGNQSRIEGTNGKSNGIIPWIKVYNSTLSSVNQGGKRKGAGVAYLEPWHIDTEDFLALRKNTGDDRMRAHDTHTALWMPDLFMHRVEQDGDWYLFDPGQCPELHELFGKEFDAAYHKCVALAEAGEIKIFKKMKAKDLWKQILRMVSETGHPWITFKDPCNIRYTNQHVGTVHHSNLCTEITLHTKPTDYSQRTGEVKNNGETAVCNLLSINLSKYVDPTTKKLLREDLQRDIQVMIRMLDNVIDINLYPTPDSQESNIKHRPIGFGSMGWVSLYRDLGVNYNSEEAIRLTSEVQELLAYLSIEASCRLAKERGKYSTYKGSLWDQGVFPQDAFKNTYATQHSAVREQMDWYPLRDLVAAHGMRNSNVMAIAPTATISYIVGTEQSIEPNYGVSFVYTTLSGDFTLVDEHFVADCKAEGLWTPELLEMIKSSRGEVGGLPLPDWMKNKYATAFEIPTEQLIQCAAARQMWIDQAQSFNLYFEGNSMKKLSDIYFSAWKSGLKTTYYLRTRGASKSEAAKVETKACRIDDPTCEACQ
jgi:ribonucleoside-diphosphate reductase alpha chain